MYNYYNYISDIQFYVFMKHATDLSRDEIYLVFDILDVDHSGLMDFDEFYLLIAILIAIKVYLLFLCYIRILPTIGIYCYYY